jgi:hypothetical protein
LDLGDNRDGPPGSGNEVVRRSCCLVERDDIVGSRINGWNELDSSWLFLPDDISGMIRLLLPVLTPSQERM